MTTTTAAAGRPPARLTDATDAAWNQIWHLTRAGSRPTTLRAYYRAAAAAGVSRSAACKRLQTLPRARIIERAGCELWALIAPPEQETTRKPHGNQTETTRKQNPPSAPPQETPRKLHGNPAETPRKQNPPPAPLPSHGQAAGRPPSHPEPVDPSPPPAGLGEFSPAHGHDPPPPPSIYPRTRGLNNSLHSDSSSKNQETITPPSTPPETLTPDSQPREETKQAAARLLCDLAAALYGGVPRIPRQARRPLAALCLATIYAGGIPLAEQACTLPPLAKQSHVSDPLRYLTGCIANRTEDRQAFLKLANTIDPRPIYPAITAEFNRRRHSRLRQGGNHP